VDIWSCGERICVGFGVALLRPRNFLRNFLIGKYINRIGYTKDSFNNQILHLKGFLSTYSLIDVRCDSFLKMENISTYKRIERLLTTEIRIST